MPRHFSSYSRRGGSGSSGIAVELVRNGTCNECGKPLIGVAGLVVFRYRGTQAACRNLIFHKECVPGRHAEVIEPHSLHGMRKAERY
jgi:hypothetical protein